MSASRLLRGVVLCLLLIPHVLHAQDTPRIVLHEDITDARGDQVDTTTAPVLILVTGTVVNARNLYVYVVVQDGEGATIQSTAGLGYIISDRFDFFGHCMLGRPEETAARDQRYEVFAVVTDQAYERDQTLEETTVIARSNVIVLFRPGAPPQPAPPLQPVPLAPSVPPPQPASPPQPVPMTQPAPLPQPGMTARITSPRDGATVGHKIAVEGVIAGLRPPQQVFVCLKSQAFGRLIYPQGEVLPDATGQWTVESIYATPGYRYETFLVVTTNPAAAAMLQDQQARLYGIRDLPPSRQLLGAAIVVTRE